jgi:hypothetical protein
MKSLVDKKYENFQQIIKDNYLKSYDEQSDCVTGIIQRPIHGAMHVARVQWWVLVLHKIIKQQLPEYCATIMRHFENNWHLKENEILTLARYAALFHDSAREDEHQDRWDVQSAEKCRLYLVQKGVTKALASTMANAAAFKDKPANFNIYLATTFDESRGMDKKKNSEAWNYIRRLIAAADCLDIMRCCGVFSFDKLWQYLNAIPNSTHLKFCIIDLCKNVYEVIKNQNDMLFPCSIKFSDDEFYHLHKSQSFYNESTKVKYEFADDVCSAVGSDIASVDYFNQYVSDKSFAHTKLSTVIPAFNPYLHGTTSGILSLLPKTHFTLTSAINMLDTYKLAPFSGEQGNALWGHAKGGFSHLNPQSKMFFGRLQSVSGDYQLPNILEYANGKGPYHFPLSLSDKLDSTIQNKFKNINTVISDILQAKQKGQNIVPACLNKINSDIIHAFKAYIMACQMVTLLGTTIAVDMQVYNTVRKKRLNDIKKLDSSSPEYVTECAKIREFNDEYNECKPTPPVDQYKTQQIERLQREHPFKENLFKIDFKHLIERILESNDSLKVDYNENPDQFLKFSVNLLNSFLVENNATLFIKGSLDHTDCEAVVDIDVGEMLGDQLGCTLGWYVYNEINQSSCLNRFVDIHVNVNEHIDLLRRKLELLEYAVNFPVTDAKLSEEALSYAKKPFPIILFCESEDKIHLANLYSLEYFSEQDLVFGVDIKTIATDTQQHKLILDRFMQEHDLDVQVMLISQLEACNRTKKAPIIEDYVKDLKKLTVFSSVTSSKCSTDNTPKLESREVKPR